MDSEHSPVTVKHNTSAETSWQYSDQCTVVHLGGPSRPVHSGIIIVARWTFQSLENKEKQQWQWHQIRALILCWSFLEKYGYKYCHISVSRISVWPHWCAGSGGKQWTLPASGERRTSASTLRVRKMFWFYWVVRSSIRSAKIVCSCVWVSLWHQFV